MWFYELLCGGLLWQDGMAPHSTDLAEAAMEEKSDGFFQLYFFLFNMVLRSGKNMGVFFRYFT